MAPLPLAAGETVTALAVNAARPDEVAVTTPRKNPYVWQERQWRRIVAEGWEAPCPERRGTDLTILRNLSVDEHLA